MTLSTVKQLLDLGDVESAQQVTAGMADHAVKERASQMIQAHQFAALDSPTNRVLRAAQRPLVAAPSDPFAGVVDVTLAHGDAAAAAGELTIGGATATGKPWWNTEPTPEPDEEAPDAPSKQQDAADGRGSRTATPARAALRGDQHRGGLEPRRDSAMRSRGRSCQA